MKRLLIVCFIALLFTSCKVFDPSQMLRTKADYKYAQYSDTLIKDYRIATDDIVYINVLPNNGERLLSVIGDQGSSGTSDVKGMSYVIENDGTTRLPMLGSVGLAGLTKKEAEAMLEKKYAEYINLPYVKVTVDNRRVFVFRGGSQSSVVKLENQNTTLFEVLAQTGGTNDSKAHRIKLIRKVSGVPQVYLIDLSKVDNINQGNIVLQSNDIIYITPRAHTAERILATIAPYLSLIATAMAVIAIFK
jgi:polysaccharide biosynthesis/export protein